MKLVAAPGSPAKTRAETDRVKALSELDAEVIGLFVQLSRVLGQPRSLAEIYGLLFISAKPLAMDNLIERRGHSKVTSDGKPDSGSICNSLVSSSPTL